jgi:thiamine-monophosphate kinase
MTLHNEDDLVRWLTRRWPASPLPVGPGHDCAVLESLPPRAFPVIKTDALVENVHFTTQTPARKIGHKAIARVLSDFAAAGAFPTAALIALGLPQAVDRHRLDRIYQGLEETATAHRVTLAGGEITRSRDLWITLSGYGHASKLVRRSGAASGDWIVVTGALGATQKQHHYSFTPRLAEGQWLARNGGITSMMDVSDGLGKDLPRLARASGLSFAIQADSLPKRNGCSADQAINDGEDFELLFTLPPRRWKKLLAVWPFATPLTPIGTMLPAGQPPDHDGLRFTGFDHWSA